MSATKRSTNGLDVPGGADGAPGKGGGFASSDGSISHETVRRRLLPYLLAHKKKLVLGLTCGVLVGFVQPGTAYLIKVFVDSLTRHDRWWLGLACVLIVAGYAALGVLRYGQSIFLADVAQRVGLAMRRDVYAHLQSLSLAYFHRRRTGALMSTLNNDVGKLQSAAMMVKDVVATPAQAVITFGFMLRLSWRLTLVTLIVVPFVAAFIQRLTRRIRGYSRESQRRAADVSALMEETLAAPRIVRAFTAENHEITRFERVSEDAIQVQLRQARRSAILGPTVDLIGAAGLALVLYVGGIEVLSGQMSSGSLMSYLFLVSQLANSANSIGGLKNSWEEMMGAADRIFGDVLDIAPDIQDAPGAEPLPPVEGRIEFRDVYFSYGRGISALSEIDLVVEPGQVVALVGETGAGKSTLADMVPRFYDPTEGCVLIDGHDLRSVTVESLRRQIGIVPQDPVLFSGTIRENIAYGRRDATEEEVRAAARAANADSFIESFPQDYDTPVGERGMMLSGGEKQRVTIARALLADPRILILDEATSSLDAATEALVQEALEVLMKGRTTIIIAHRLSTIVNADRIVVLRRGGRIAEMGTHADLLAKGGIYAALFESQRRAAELSAGVEL